jgi:hypothetical protein
MNKKCDGYQEELAAFLYGELSAEASREMETHLESCSSCRQEMNVIKKVFNGANTLNPEMEAAMEAVDWESLPDRIADRVLGRGSRRSSLRGSGIWSYLTQPRMRPVFAALFLGLIVGAALTFLTLRPFQRPEMDSSRLIVSDRFLESMDIEVARRATLDYLDRSQYLLLDLVQTPPDKAADFWNSDIGSQRAKDLLSKKKYIDQQLDNFQMAKAKALCDQIGLLFLDLSQISQGLTTAELAKLQNLIQERKLFLKIKLIKKELQESEV